MPEVLFSDPERATRNFERIAASVPESVRNLLPTLLVESPDPDSALNLFERLCAESDREVLRRLEARPPLLHYALVVFGHSHFLGETLIQNSDLFAGLERELAAGRTFSRDDFNERFARLKSRSFDPDVALLLARFKRREYVRIMLRDVLGLATLADVTAEISALADVLIEQAWLAADALLRERYGAPLRRDTHGRETQIPFAVLSLGKLGGNELNYSSDVDLLFLFGDGEALPDRSISNREYFIRLAQEITGILSRLTREGSVFRIDLRLRPQGHEGEPAIALRHAEHYYAETAHDWELQALIKARHSA